MCKFCNLSEARAFNDMFFAAVRIVSGNTWEVTGDKRIPYRQTYAGREWFIREHKAHRIHPAVEDTFALYRPHDWHQLLLEWPHKSVNDANKVAYTENERKGEADRQTVTTLGKYLRRHFPSIPDHELRDIVARHTYSGGIQVINNLEEMVNTVCNGPRSCMSGSFDIRCNDGEHRHPYEVYDPALGWSMAVRVQDGNILGRCLLWTEPNEGAPLKGFVRSYKRNPDERSHSGVDEAIEAYLLNEGYTKWSAWPDGARLIHYPVNNGFLAPYIDGHTQCVEIYNEDYLEIDSNGDYACDNTGGTSSASICECEDCGAEIFDEDDITYVGRGEDGRVCNNCIDNYTYAYGRRGYQYYVNNDNVVYVNDEAYDEDYLSDNDIVELHDGDYVHMDDAVMVHGEWYLADDSDVCYAEDTEQYELREDCWQCYDSDVWYTNDTDYVEVDGKTYHPDNAPETEPNE